MTVTIFPNPPTPPIIPTRDAPSGPLVLRGSRARLSMVGAFSVPVGAISSIVWDTRDYDVGNFAPGVAGFAGFTAPVDGWYLIGAFVGLSADVDENLLVAIVNGAATVLGTNTPSAVPPPPEVGGITTTGTVRANAGDVLRAFVAPDDTGGGTRDIIAFSNFWIELVEAA